MKINSKELRKLIREAIQSESMYVEGSIPKDKMYGAVRGGEVPGPFEYKLATAIANSFESHEMAVGASAHVGQTWPSEVDRAAADLEEALLDSGALDSLLQLVDAVSQKLHNGEYS